MAPASDAARLLHEALLRFGPDVTLEEHAGLRRYLRGGRLFAAARPMATRVDVGFSRLGKARSKRILDGTVARLGGVRHRVVVEAPGDVDTELMSWLRESYEALDD